MRRMLLLLLICLMPLNAMGEATVLKDTKTCWMDPVHLRVEDGLLYMTMDGRKPYQPVAVQAGFVEAVRALEASDERYDLDPDRMNRELKALLDDSLTGGRNVFQLDVQQDQIVLLLEGPGDGKTLRIATWNGEGYDVLDNPTFPASSAMDTTHIDEGALIFIDVTEFSGIGVYLSCDEEDRSSWRLGMRIDWPLEDCEWRWNAVVDPSIAQDGRNDGYYYGDFPQCEQEFEIFDASACPTSLEQAVAALDRRGWAVVNNPDPADGLNLFVLPDRDAPSLGEFYNKTPVWIIGTWGEWSRVAIGEEGLGLTGWMMTSSLAFGEDMDDVACAFPLDERAENGEKRYCEAWAAPNMSTAPTWIYYFGEDSVIGVLGDEWYIVIDNWDGRVGYVPQP